VVAGEVEHRSQGLLRDAWEGKLQPVYRLIIDWLVACFGAKTGRSPKDKPGQN
jgi:hypothetical protein